MITAQLFGGPRDGEIVTVSGPCAPVPDVLYFPDRVGPALPGDAVPDPLALSGGPLITAIRYRLRLPPRCCATWCVWPRRCNCCPRCYVKRLSYDLDPGGLR